VAVGSSLLGARRIFGRRFANVRCILCMEALCAGLLCLGLTLPSGCATAAPTRGAPATARTARILVDSGALPPEIFADAVPEAMRRLAARGFTLSETTRIVVHASPFEFARATGKTDAELRAWTTFRTVHLMPLDLWHDSTPEAVVERVAHELCHAAIYQRFGSEERARKAAIPRFFEEGTCSVVAGQEARRMPRDHVVALAPPQPLHREIFHGDPELAYAAAHHVMALLDERHGPSFLARIVEEAAADGAAGSIERAILRATGLDPEGLWQLLVDETNASS
jgi:hypothetical protein